MQTFYSSSARTHRKPQSSLSRSLSLLSLSYVLVGSLPLLGTPAPTAQCEDVAECAGYPKNRGNSHLLKVPF